MTRVVALLEAYDNLLGFFLSECSVQVIFLPSDLSLQKKTLKSQKDIKRMTKESTDIFCAQKIESYVNRPAELRDVSYPEYFRFYGTLYEVNAQGNNNAANKRNKHYKDLKNRCIRRLNVERIVRFAFYEKENEQLRLFCRNMQPKTLR
jgi:hypothetical protein